MKLKAFTIMEILISIIISSIVIALSISIYEVVIKMHLNFKHKTEVTRNLTQLNYLLNNDFFSSDSTYVFDNKLELTSIANNYSVEYFFLKKTIIRNQLTLSDTFNFDEINTFLYKKHLSSKLDSININAQTEKQNFMFNYVIQYDANELIKH